MLDELRELDEFAPVKMTLTWGTPGKKSVFMIELPWDASGNSFAEAFQSMMAAYGFCESTIKDYVESDLMNREDDTDYSVAEELEEVCRDEECRKPSGGPEEGLQDD